MVVHVVMFKFLDKNKQQNILEIKDKLEFLKKDIDTIVDLEIGIDINRGSRAYDMSLLATFKTEDDLKQYATHPKHLEVLEFIHSVTEQSVVVDYIK